MACSFTATGEGLLLSGNSVPTDVFTQPLLPVINELSECVWKQLVYLRDTCVGAVTERGPEAMDFIGKSGGLL